LAIAAVLCALGGLWPSDAQAHWVRWHVHYYHWYGGHPYVHWQYVPTVTLPPVYVYAPYGVYYTGYYPLYRWHPPGAYRYVYPYVAVPGAFPVVAW